MTAAAGTSPSAATSTLTGWLRALPDDALAELVTARPDLVAPVPADMQVLAARAGVQVSVARALEQLDRFTAETLEALCVLPDPTSYDDLRATVGGEDVRAPLDRLRTLALVWGPDAELRVVRAARGLLGDHPFGLGRPLAACLSRYGFRQLEPVADAVGVPFSGDRDAVVSGLSAAFADRARLTALITECSDGAAAILDRLAAGPPVGSTTPGAALRPVRAEDADGPIAELLARALLVGIDDDRVELPREVGVLRRGPAPTGPLHPSPPSLTGERIGAKDVDEGSAQAAGETVRLAERLLSAWAAEPPALLRTGGVGVRDLRAAARLLEVDEQQTALLVETVYAAGLLDATGGVEQEAVPTSAYDRWLAAPQEERWAALAEAWLASPRVAGFVGERDERGRPAAPLSAELMRTSAVEIRRGVLGTMAEAPRGLVPTVESIRDRLAWYAPYRRGTLAERLLRWTLVEAGQLGVTGRGALGAPGRALLSSGAAAAGRALGPLLPAPVEELLIQADLTAVAPGPLAPELSRELALIADIESAGAATVYRFSEGSVRRGLDAGMSSDEIRGLLARLARTGVPQALDYLVEDVARRHGALRTGTASSYVRCDDPALLAEVLAARRTQSLGLRRIAPTVLVSSSPVGRMLEVMRAAGYAPVAEAPDGQVVLSRPEERRVPARPRPARPDAVAVSGPRPEQIPVLIRQLRRGDEALQAGRRAQADAQPVPDDAPPVPASRSAATLALLQAAVAGERRVWLGYVDQQGNLSQRIVAPLAVEGGYLRAWDERSDAMRTFALHRVTGVEPVEETS